MYDVGDISQRRYGVLNRWPIVQPNGGQRNERWLYYIHTESDFDDLDNVTEDEVWVVKRIIATNRKEQCDFIRG